MHILDVLDALVGALVDALDALELSRRAKFSPPYLLYARRCRCDDVCITQLSCQASEYVKQITKVS
jgi:hypothetical protein